MQKRALFGRYIDIPLKEEPLYFFPYTQRYRTKGDMHYHNGVGLGLCIGGEGVFFLEDRLFHFCKGSVSVVLTGERHVAQSPNHNPSEWYFLTIDPEALGLPFPDYMANPILSDKNITDLMQLICRELDRRQEDSADYVIFLLRSLCVLFHRSNAGSEPVTESENSEAILPALSYMAQHYMDEITVEQLAKECFLSVPYFRRVFKRCTRTSPMSYLAEVRLKMAAVLLRTTDDPISEIALNVGFITLSAFNRKFHDYYGMPPREWRKSL